MKDNKSFWEKSAKFYSLQEKGNSELYEQTAAFTAQYLNKSKKVLELGCGTGQLAIRLHDYTRSYIATDFSPKMIKNALKRKIEGVSFKEMDASNITFDDGSFDVVIVANVLHIVENPASILKECHRVLKEGGLLIAPTFVYDDEPTGVRIKFLKLMGFKTYNEWKSKDYLRFIRNNGFRVIESKEMSTKITGNLFLAAKKV